MNDFELSIDCGEFSIKVKNLKVSCYGAIGLMDFDYHLQLEIVTSNGKTKIIQEFSEDIGNLYFFCDSMSELRGRDDCSLNIYQKEGFQFFEFNKSNLHFVERAVYQRDRLNNFFIELKACFEYLIYQYIKDHPEN